MTTVAPKQSRIMYEGKLIYREFVLRDGEAFYVEKVAFKDWHVGLHNFYLISDRLCAGATIVEQNWDYNDFCDITIRLEDYTFSLNRQVEYIVLVRSYKSIPVDEFCRIARPLLFTEKKYLSGLRRRLINFLLHPFCRTRGCDD